MDWLNVVSGRRAIIMSKLFVCVIVCLCVCAIVSCKSYQLSGSSKSQIRSIDTIIERQSTHVKEKEWARGDTIFHVFETKERIVYDNTHYRDTIIRDTVWMNLVDDELEKAAYTKGKNSGFFIFFCLVIFAGLFFFVNRSDRSK